MNYFKNEFDLFIIITLLSNILQSNAELNFKYPTSISLENENIFVIEENGIYICNSDFTEIIKKVKSFDTEEEKISTLEKLSTVILIRRSDYIISLINYKVYFFDMNGNYKFNTEKLIQDCTPTSISLSSTYSLGGYTEYVLSYFDSDIKLNLLLYSYNFDTNISKFIAKDVEDNLKRRKYNGTSYYYDSTDTAFNFKDQGLSCLSLAKNGYTNQKFFVCFFVASSGYYEYLEEMVFEIDINEIKLSTAFEHGYINQYNIIQIKAETNKKIDLALVCITIKDNLPICYKFTLYFDYAKFDEIKIFDNKCRDGLYGTKITFLHEISNIVFSCLLDEGNDKLQIGIFDSDIDLYRDYYDFLSCSNIYGHSIIYSNNNYKIISDIQCGEDNTPITDKTEIGIKTTEIIYQGENDLTTSIITSGENVKTSIISSTGIDVNTEKTSIIISSTDIVDNIETTSIILNTSNIANNENSSIITSNTKNIENLETINIILSTNNNINIEKNSIILDISTNASIDPDITCPIQCKKCIEVND